MSIARSRATVTNVVRDSRVRVRKDIEFRAPEGTATAGLERVAIGFLMSVAGGGAARIYSYIHREKNPSRSEKFRLHDPLGRTGGSTRQVSRIHAATFCLWIHRCLLPSKDTRESRLRFAVAAAAAVLLPLYLKLPARGKVIPFEILFDLLCGRVLLILLRLLYYAPH